MPTKEAVATALLFELLESRYALRVLWGLRTPPLPTFRELQERVPGITPSTLNTRLKALRDAGLVDHKGDGYSLTPAGTELVRRLGDVPAFAARWAALQTRQP